MLVTNIIVNGEVSTLFVNKIKGFEEIIVLTSDIEKLLSMKIRVLNKVLKRIDIKRLERKCEFVLKTKEIAKKKRARDVK